MDDVIPAGSVVESVEEILEVPWDVRAVADKVENKSVPIVISEDAGTSVCNYIYYKLLHGFNQNSGVRTLFMHIPFFEEQLPLLSGDELVFAREHVLPRNDVKQTMVAFIECLCEDVGKKLSI